MSNEKSFVKGTVILVASSMVVKVLSAVYRIPLTRMLGAEAMGTYTAVFNLFLPFYSFATAGITPAVSRLSTEIEQQGFPGLMTLRKKSSRIFGFFSLAMIALALTVSAIYSNSIETPFLFYGVALLCPNLFFATFEAIYKGISQGSMNMGVTAKANVLESVSKIVIGLGAVFLAGILIKGNPEPIQIILALSTVSVAGFICWIYMSWDFSAGSVGQKKDVPIKVTSKRVLSMALPISLSALVVSGTNFFDTVICLSIIKSIPSESLINSYNLLDLSSVGDIPIWLFGVYQGLTVTVVNLIPSLSSAIGASSLPVITKSKLSGNQASLERQVSKLMRFTSACVVPASMFVLFFADDVIITLFGDKGAQSTLAAIFLRLIAPTAILSAFSFPLNSVLHAFEKSSEIFKILIIGGAVKVGVSWYLCSIPSVNIKGCIYSSVLFYILVFILTVSRVKAAGLKLKLFSVLFIPIGSSYVILTVLAILAKTTLMALPIWFRCIIMGAFFLLFYGFFLLISNFLIDNYD